MDGIGVANVEIMWGWRRSLSDGVGSNVWGWGGDGKTFYGDGVGTGMISTTVSLFSGNGLGGKGLLGGNSTKYTKLLLCYKTL